PEVNSLGGIGCELSEGDAKIQSFRSPHVRKLPRYTLIRLTPGRCLRAADPAYLNGVVAKALDSPRGVIHTSVLESIPCADVSRPRCRFCCAPWIETTPNTATALVATIASDRTRVVGALRWVSAIRGDGRLKAGWSHANTTTAPSNRNGRAHSNAMTRVRLPSFESCG